MTARAKLVSTADDGLRAAGLSKQALYWRLKNGWPLDMAVVTPVRKHRRRAKVLP
jgi:hypothetical protein